MKTVRVTADHDYRPRRKICIAYKAGRTYASVPEAAVRSILAANAGEIVDIEVPRRSGAFAQRGGYAIA